MSDTLQHCKYPDCDRSRSPKAGRGLCHLHYRRLRDAGEIEKYPRANDRTAEASFPLSPNALARFRAKYAEKESGCWEWHASKTPDGYGMVWAVGKHMGAHRVAYLHHVGPIPIGLELDHLCRNRGCVNPDHLEPVMTAENLRRSANPPAINGRKTHCIRGHRLSGSNLVVHARGTRECVACRVRPFTCESCGKTMCHKSRLAHQRRIHGGS